MNKIFLIFLIYFGIFTNGQSTSDSRNYPPAPGYNTSYPSPYDKKKVSAPVAPPEAVVGKMDLKDVIINPDQPAQFPGTYDGFRSAIGKNIDTREYKGSERYFSTSIYLIIDQKGMISDVYIDGPENNFNQSVKKAIAAINTPWKPAVHDQKEVKSLNKVLMFKLYIN